MGAGGEQGRPHGGGGGQSSGKTVQPTLPSCHFHMPLPAPLSPLLTFSSSSHPKLPLLLLLAGAGAQVRSAIINCPGARAVQKVSSCEWVQGAGGASGKGGRHRYRDKERRKRAGTVGWQR